MDVSTPTRLRKPWKKVCKIVGGVLVLIVVYCVFHVLLALHPSPLFSDHRSYGNFTVHMREQIPSGITQVLDRTQSLLSTSELNDKSLHHDVYIFNNYKLIHYLMLRNVHFGANLPNGITFITDADVDRDIARCRLFGPRDNRLRTLSESIAHEITHHLIRLHLGRRAERRLPAWIREGYCEYVAQGAVIDDATGLSLLKNGGLPVRGFLNYRHRLMMEYLINERGLSIVDILQSPPDFDTVYVEMLTLLREDEEGFLLKARSRPETVILGQ